MAARAGVEPTTLRLREKRLSYSWSVTALVQMRVFSVT